MTLKRHKIYKRYKSSNRITLCHGDCIKLLQSLPDNSVQLIVTSPPYNIGKEYEDKDDLELFLESFKPIIQECWRVLKEEGSICWQVGSYVQGQAVNIPLDIKFYPIFDDIGFQLKNRIIWHFGHGFHRTNSLSGRYETINWYVKSNNYLFNLDSVRVKQKYRGKRYPKGHKKEGKPSGNKFGMNPSDFWTIPFEEEISSDVWLNMPNVKSKHIEKTDHPCQFPIALVRRLVKMLSNKNHLVFDPFAGVGTTLIGAVIEGRRTAGVELIDDYIIIAEERLRNLMAGKLKFREDKQLYSPPKTLRVAQEPSADEW